MYATSTYRFPIKLLSVTSSDPRIAASLTNSTLQPGQRTRIGIVTFDPSLGGDDYMGSTEPWLPNAQSGHGASVAANEVIKLHDLAKLWQQMEASNRTVVEAELHVIADLSVSAKARARGTLTRPTLTPGGDHVSFPLTQVQDNAHK